MKMRTMAVILAVTLFGASWAEGGQPASLQELAAYTGADREQLLAAGAKREGRVTWYTSLAGGSYKELAAAFEKKYPGVKVEAYRGSSQDLMARIMAEAQARRYLVDTVESTMPLMKAMRDDKLITPFYSPHLGKYPAEAKEKADRGLFFFS
ncbi:MAG: extracellular solute-binding protein [Deltaproteobacteria bacterium]|nr:extracellular solute-binding protein [Deltaproteobacteria bacterium]